MNYELKNSASPRIVYADIIDLPHHRSDVHPHMSIHDRAAQFAPFAALTGYDEMISEEARLTDSRIDLGESDLEQLDRKLRRLSALLAERRRPQVSALIFTPDPRKAGGRYDQVSGQAERLDTCENRLILCVADSPVRKISLDLDRILDLSGDCLEDPE